MATALEIADLRALVDDKVEPYEFEDAELGGHIDAAGGDLRAAAGTVWAVKASRLAGLVDVTEGSSSRKMSQLHQQALAMAKYYGGEPTPAATTSGRSGTRPIVRP
jgi:hypothetical protein